MTNDEIFEKLCKICDLFSEQLHEYNLFNDILNRQYPVDVFKGLLLETHHYIRLFPDVIWHAVCGCAEDTQLHQEFLSYYQQEKGHEVFAL